MNQITFSQMVFIPGAFAAVHNIKDAKWYRQTASNWCWAAVSETMIDKETLILRQMGLPIDKRESFMQRTIIPIILLGHQQI